MESLRNIAAIICKIDDKRNMARLRHCILQYCTRLCYVVVVPKAVRQASPGTLGAEIRRLRERARRTIHDVVEELGWSSSKLSRLETSLSSVKDEDLTRLLDLYGVADDERSRIRALADDPLRRHLGGSRPGITEVLDRYIRLEAIADQISLYGAIVVPGLLQTPEYAAAVIHATPTPEHDLVKERMITRMGRQALLGLQSGPRLGVVIDEAVLRRPVGGKHVMRRQMLRLCELSERPDTTIQVLPFALGAHPAVTGQFAILDFGDGPTQVFCDGLTGGVLRDSPEDVQRYRSCFAALLELALSEEESVRMLAATAQGGRGDEEERNY
jgi:transcriptional regulator with XRE-family HTH domain